jgi:hypothetical protein
MWKTSSCRVDFDEVHYQDREEERKEKGKKKRKAKLFDELL